MTTSMPETEKEVANRRLTLILYGLHALGFLTGGVTNVIAVIVNYVKGPDVANTWMDSHFQWQIRSFWGALIGMVIGTLTAPIGIGLILLLGTTIWFLYRVIKGWLWFNDKKPMYTDRKPLSIPSSPFGPKSRP